MPMRVLRTAVLAGFVATMLAGCDTIGSVFGSSSEDTPPASATTNCPPASGIVPTSSLTTFQPGKRDDPKGILYRVAVKHVRSDCSFDQDNGITDSSLTIDFTAHRPDPGPEATYRVPYYVAVSQGTRILDKRDIWVSFTFPAGAQDAPFSDNVESTKITLENGKRPYEYQILVGFQLTHDQLEYNKTMSSFGP